jgi:hypothetical protein
MAESEARRVLIGTKPGAKDPSDALRLLATLAFRAPESEQRRYLEWLFAAVALGDVEDLRWFLDRSDSTQKLSAMFEALSRESQGGFELTSQPATLEEHKGEVAYVFAGFATSSVRDALAADAHRVALEFVPTHPWASNDLGYSILERGGDIKEAERLIEQAAAAVPDRSTVTDSLGWLRYKQGRMGDDATGMGAVSLLTKASQMDEGSLNEEVLDHLGDALWRWNADGSRAEAARTWTRAVTIMQLDVRQRQTLDQNAESARVKALRAELVRVQKKIDAAKAGQEPAVAEIGIPATFTPRAELGAGGAESAGPEMP